jgi:hypothetical protein
VEPARAVLLGLLVGWLFLLTSLVGVALGGYLVFRTKREAHDSLFNVKPPKGEAWVEDVIPGEPDQREDPVPELFRQQSDNFLRQFVSRNVKVDDAGI